MSWKSGYSENLVRRESYLLNVVARARVIGDLKDASKAVQAVADGDINGLTEDAVLALAVGNNLGVPTADIEHYRIDSSGDNTSHLDMGHAVVDGHDGLLPEQGENAGDHGAGLEGGAHARAFGVAEAIYVSGGEAARLFQGGVNEGQDMLLVMNGGLARQEALARGSDEGVARIGQDAPVQANDSHPDLVGRPLDP